VSTTLTVAGSGDPLGSGGRLQTCFHVDAPSATFLIDCGASALPGLKTLGIDPNGVETVLLTHLHGDHFGGLPFLVLDAQHRADRTAPLRIVGPPGVAERVRAAMEVFFPGLPDVEQSFDLSFAEFDDGEPTAVGPLRVTPHEVVHPSGAPSFALQVTVDGSTVAYSGDTEWTDALVDVARGAELFLCEAYAYDEGIPYHLSYERIDAERHRLAAERVVLTHMRDAVLDRREEIDFETAADGDRFVL
jgi:ribonuclease BN (tRNA processing enzyme)